MEYLILVFVIILFGEYSSRHRFKKVETSMEEIKEDICDNYCKFTCTADCDGNCEPLQDGRGCPLDRMSRFREYYR